MVNVKTMSGKLNSGAEICDFKAFWGCHDDSHRSLAIDSLPRQSTVRSKDYVYPDANASLGVHNQIAIERNEALGELSIGPEQWRDK